MNRFFDFLLSLIGLIVFSPILIILTIVGFFDTGSPFFVQKRIGKNWQLFSLVKFRSMGLNTQSVATHLVNKNAVTRFGNFLRKSKLDELPQLWNVLKGDMSLVGPRPNLPNQKELIQERASRNVYSVRPGITGLAQIQEIDMSTPRLLAETDASMIENLNLVTYFKIIIATITGKGFGDRIKA